MVFGDFDADGLTGLAQLVLAFRRLGLETMPYVPSRLEEGHGLSTAAVEAAARDGVALIVTVDTGSTSVAEIARRGVARHRRDRHGSPPPARGAAGRGRDRQPAARGLRLPGSAAVRVGRGVHGRAAAARASWRAPKARRASSPTWRRSGRSPTSSPILGENRAIARLGLELMRTAPRPGIAALLAAGRRRGPRQSTSRPSASRIAPRLNAAGRVGEALDAARLLLAASPGGGGDPRGRARGGQRHAPRPDARRDRRGAGGVRAARTRARRPASRRGSTRRGPPTPASASPAAPTARPLLLTGPWPVGILGLVAGRLADETGRPTVVGTVIETPGGDVIRASCRSDGRLSLAAILDACDDLFLRHGGHAAAAGFELPAERWDAFVGRFLAEAASAAPEDARRPLNVDLALPASFVDYGLYRDLARLAPVRHRQPGAARRRARPHRPARAGRQRRPHAARAAPGARRARRHRVRSRRTSRRGSPRATAWTSSRGSPAARFGGLETLQLEVRDVSASGAHPRAAEVLARAAGNAGRHPRHHRVARARRQRSRMTKSPRDGATPRAGPAPDP